MPDKRPPREMPVELGRRAMAAPSAPPAQDVPVHVPVAADVATSPDRPYTVRLSVAMMNRLTRYSEKSGVGKGRLISDVMTDWLTAQEAK